MIFSKLKFSDYIIHIMPSGLAKNRNSRQILDYFREHTRYLTSEGQYGGVDILRAIAVLSVFFFHFNYFPPGWLGVDLFFVLSGFLIGGAIIKRAEHGRWMYGKFYLHRAMRILPTYYFIIFLKATLVGFPLAADPLSLVSLSSIVASLTFTQTTASWYWGWKGDGNFVPGGTWSLVIEEYFYLICPLFLVSIWSLSRKKGVLTLAVLLVCFSGPVVRYFANYDYPHDDINWYFASWLQFRSRYDTLAFGILAALIVQMWKPSRHHRAWVFASGIFLLVATLAYLVNSRMWEHSAQTTRVAALWFPFVLGASFAMILTAVYKLRCRSKAIIIIARLAFGIYLGHIFLQEFYGAYHTSANLLIQWVGRLSGLEIIVLYSIATFALSYAMSILVEYPFIRIYRKPVPAEQGMVK